MLSLMLGRTFTIEKIDIHLNLSNMVLAVFTYGSYQVPILC